MKKLMVFLLLKSLRLCQSSEQTGRYCRDYGFELSFEPIGDRRLLQQPKASSGNR